VEELVRWLDQANSILVEVRMQIRPISGTQNVNCSAWRRYALYRVLFYCYKSETRLKMTLYLEQLEDLEQSTFQIFNGRWDAWSSVSPDCIRKSDWIVNNNKEQSDGNQKNKKNNDRINCMLFTAHTYSQAIHLGNPSFMLHHC